MRRPRRVARAQKCGRLRLERLELAVAVGRRRPRVIHAVDEPQLEKRRRAVEEPHRDVAVEMAARAHETQRGAGCGGFRGDAKFGAKHARRSVRAQRRFIRGQGGGRRASKTAWRGTASQSRPSRARAPPRGSPRRTPADRRPLGRNPPGPTAAAPTTPPSLIGSARPSRPRICLTPIRPNQQRNRQPAAVPQ